MGRCCSLCTRSTCRNLRPTCTHHHRTAVHLLYPVPYASIYMQYILLPPPTCFSAPTPLTPVTVTVVYSVYPLNWSCLYHVFTTECLCIYKYYVHLPNAGYVQHLLFPFPLLKIPS